MRLAHLPLLVAPALLADCGSHEDLIIGLVLRQGEAGTSSSAGSGGSEPTAGTLATAGAGGSSAATGGSGGTEAALAGAAGEPAEDCVAGDLPPPDSLIHRYTFDGSGAVASDELGGQDGTLVGAMLDGSGTLSMNAAWKPGADHEYVDLPNGIVSSLTDMTVVTWTTWSGEAAYARVFDFGIGNAVINGGEALGMTGINYLTVMPKTGFANQTKPGLGAELKVPGFATVTLASAENIKNRLAQVGFVFKSGQSAALYLDGSRLAIESTDITLGNIDDRNNWIGQSQYRDNPPYIGSYREFRIYDVALNGCQLYSLLLRGPESP